MFGRRSLAGGIALASALSGLSSLPAAAQTGDPSRPAVEGCVWEQVSDASVGLAAWVQRCDFGDRQISLALREGGLWMDYSDGGEPFRVIEVFAMEDGETAEGALERIYAANTDPAVAARCVLRPDTLTTAPDGVLRYTFVPDEAYQAELDATQNPDEVPEPPCGDYGYPPDSIDYFEVQPDADRVLFVIAGQDEPLFDADTLQILASGGGKETSDEPVACCGYEAGEQGVIADFLLESCSVPGETAYGMIPFFDCQSYVLAVIDSVRGLEHELGVCLPADITARDVLDLVTQTYDYTQDGQRRAAGVLIAAMEHAYACE